MQLIFQNPPPLMHGLFTIGICCGLRLGDVATLRWSEIEGYAPNLVAPDFYLHEIIRVTRKTKAVVHIPIERELADYLRTQYEISGQEEYILPDAARLYLEHQNVLNNRILGYLHSLGIQTQRSIPGRTRKQSVKDFHSLRHCFCDYAGMRGVPLPVVQSIVGHLTASMTKQHDEALSEPCGQESPYAGSCPDAWIDWRESRKKRNTGQSAPAEFDRVYSDGAQHGNPEAECADCSDCRFRQMPAAETETNRTSSKLLMSGKI